MNVNTKYMVDYSANRVNFGHVRPVGSVQVTANGVKGKCFRFHNSHRERVV